MPLADAGSGDSAWTCGCNASPTVVCGAGVMTVCDGFAGRSTKEAMIDLFWQPVIRAKQPKNPVSSISRGVGTEINTAVSMPYGYKIDESIALKHLRLIPECELTHQHHGLFLLLLIDLLLDGNLNGFHIDFATPVFNDFGILNQHHGWNSLYS